MIWISELFLVGNDLEKTGSIFLVYLVFDFALDFILLYLNELRKPQTVVSASCGTNCVSEEGSMIGFPNACFPKKRKRLKIENDF